MKKIIVIFFLVSIGLGTSAQTNFDKTWVTGSFGKFIIDFNNGNGIADTFQNNNVFNYYFSDGVSNICDSNGRLLLFTNGFTLFDSLGNIVMGGDTLVSSLMFRQQNGFPYSGLPQTALFLPMGNGIYYLIIPNATDSVYANWYSVPYTHEAIFNQLLCYKIDITANGGLPKVVDTILLMDSVRMFRTMMMACKHANGQDWWLVKQMQEYNGQFVGPYPLSKNKIAKILISNSGISTPNVQYFPTSYTGYFEQVGQAMFNCDGSKYAFTHRHLNKIFLADFDRNSGVLSNPQFINVPYVLSNPLWTTYDSITHGVCFSPNRQFVYVARNNNILQYDLLDTDTATQWYHVANIDTTPVWFNGYTTLGLGPDNRLYVGYAAGGGRSISYIDSPSIKGVGCGWKPKGLSFPTSYFGVSAPPCMPYYDMDLVPCDTSVSHGSNPEPDGVAQWIRENGQLNIYPNPANNLLHVNIAGNYTDYQYELISLDGRKLQAGRLAPQLDIRVLHSGVYLLRIWGAKGSITKRIMKE